MATCTVKPAVLSERCNFSCGMTRQKGQISWHNTTAQSVFNLPILGSTWMSTEHKGGRQDHLTSPQKKKTPHLFFKVNEGSRKQVKKPKELWLPSYFIQKKYSASHSIHSLTPFNFINSVIVLAIISVRSICPRALSAPLLLPVVHLLQHLTNPSTTATFSW